MNLKKIFDSISNENDLLSEVAKYLDSQDFLEQIVEYAIDEGWTLWGNPSYEERLTCPIVLNGRRCLVERKDGQPMLVGLDMVSTGPFDMRFDDAETYIKDLKGAEVIIRDEKSGEVLAEGVIPECDTIIS